MTTIKLRRGTAAGNPVLAAGEPGHNTDTGELKVGDGATPFALLALFGGGFYDARRSGVKADGTTDDRAALAAADAKAFAAGLPLLLPNGTIKVASNLAIRSHVISLRGSGALLKPSNGVLVTLRNGFDAPPMQRSFDHSAGGTVIPMGVPVFHPGWWGSVLTERPGFTVTVSGSTTFTVLVNGVATGAVLLTAAGASLKTAIEAADPSVTAAVSGTAPNFNVGLTSGALTAGSNSAIGLRNGYAADGTTVANDSQAYIDMQTSLLYLAAARAFSVYGFGQRVAVPAGSTRWIGVTLSYCVIESGVGTNVFLPPLGTTSGVCLTLGRQAFLQGAFVATDETAQAVTCVWQKGHRSLVGALYCGNRAPNSTGLLSGNTTYNLTAPNSGPYVLTVNGINTASIAFGANLATIKSAIETADPTAVVTVVGTAPNFTVTPVRGYITLTTVSAGTTCDIADASITPRVAWIGGVGDATTPPTGSIGWDIASPDCKCKEFWLAGFERGIKLSRAGGFRYDEGHVWSNKVAGMKGDDADGIVGTVTYLDTNFGCGMDIDKLDRGSFPVIYSHGNNRDNNGSNAIRLTQTSGSAKDSWFGRIVINDDIGTAVLVDGPDNFQFDKVVLSSQLKQADPTIGVGGPAYATTIGMQINSNSQNTEYRVIGKDATTPVVDNGFASVRVMQPPRRIVRSSNFTKNSNTLSTSGLGFDMMANTRYLVRGLLVCSNPAAGPDMKFVVQLTSGTVTSGYFTTPAPIAVTETNPAGDLVSAANYQAIAASGGAGLPVGLTAGTMQAVQIIGFIDVGANAGTLQLFVAQNATDASNVTTFYAGSFLEVEEVA